MVYSQLQPDNTARAIAATMGYYTEPETGARELTPAVSGDAGN